MIRRILATLLLFLVIVLGGAWFLIFTSTGLHVSSGLAEIVTGGRVSIGASEGSIAANWLLRDVLVTAEVADIRIGRISCQWQPRRLMEKNLHIADLAIDDVRISIKGGKSSPEVSSTSITLPAVTLPVPVLIGRLQIDKVAIVDSEEHSLFEARSLSARLAGDGSRLQVSGIALDAPYMGGGGEARLDMSGDWPLVVNADWWVRIEGCTRFGGGFEAGGTLTDPTFHVQLSEPESLQIDGEISSLFDDFVYQVSVFGSKAELSRFCVPSSVALEELQFSLAGGREQYRGSLQTGIRLSDAELVAAQAGFSGDLETLKIDAGQLSRGSNQLDVTGSLHFGSALGWSAAVSTRAFDISELLPAPKTLIDGNLDVYGEVGGGQTSYSADLHDLGITIREHNLNIGGGLSLRGDQYGLEITSSNFVCGEGTLGVLGNLSWRDGIEWRTDLQLESFNPAVIELLPQGNISGSLVSSGSFDGSRLALQAEIASLHGELSGYEVAGQGLLAYRDDKLTVKDLNITNGKNSLQVEGDIDADYDLRFRVNGSELDRIFRPLSGQLVIEGALSGARSEPVLAVAADGRNLSYDAYRIEELHVDGSADLAAERLDADFNLARIYVNSVTADRLAGSLKGTMAAHSISAALSVPRGTLSVHAAGAAGAGFWRGTIDRLRVDDAAFGAWSIDGPVVVSAKEDSVTVDSACVSSTPNRFCPAASWGRENGWSLAVKDLRFDLASLNRWGVLEQPLSGIVVGEFSAGGVAAKLDSLRGHVAAETVQWDPGPNSYYQDLTWNDTTSAFHLRERDLIVELSTRFVDGSWLKGEIGLTGAADFSEVGQIPVHGRIDLELRDLAPLSVVTGDFLVPHGYAAGTVDVAGTLASPRLLGDVNLQNGGFHIPFLGIDLTDVHGAVGLEGRRLTLDLDSRAGQGRLNTAGGFEFGTDRWSGDLRLRGSNCTLLSRRAISADANPSLELALSPEGGQLSGTVEILHSLAEVEKIDRSASESSDVVYVDKVVESTPWPFRYDLEVTLGNDVTVQGYGLTARLSGNLRVTNHADGTTTGRGFLDVREGTFMVYGSPLKIARGRLSFDGGPVDNPGIDIKASKFIDERSSGNERIEVGANVIGSAADFEVELYSIPNMEKSDILTYILFDNPFSREGDDGTTGLITSAAKALGFGKGSDLLGNVNAMLPVDEIRLEGRPDKQETSLVVGKNLSKDLSVSYDYNLFNNAGSFRVRYEFGKGFSVESRNSFDSNAVEFMYSLER